MTRGRADPRRRVRPVHRRERAHPAVPDRPVGRGRRDLDAAGGGLEFGEPPEVAVLRELAEESGYQGEVVGLADVKDRVVTDSEGGGRMHAIRIVYRVRVIGGDLRDEIDGSTDTCGWFTLERRPGSTSAGSRTRFAAAAGSCARRSTRPTR